MSGPPCRGCDHDPGLSRRSKTCPSDGSASVASWCRHIRPAQRSPGIIKYPSASSGILQQEVFDRRSIEALFICILCPKIEDLLLDNPQGFAQVTCDLPPCRYAIFVTSYSNWSTVIAAILVLTSPILVFLPRNEKLFQSPCSPALFYQSVSWIMISLPYNDQIQRRFTTSLCNPNYHIPHACIHLISQYSSWSP